MKLIARHVAEPAPNQDDPVSGSKAVIIQDLSHVPTVMDQAPRTFGMTPVKHAAVWAN